MSAGGLLLGPSNGLEPRFRQVTLAAVRPVRKRHPHHQGHCRCDPSSRHLSYKQSVPGTREALCGGASDPVQGSVPSIQQVRCPHWGTALGMWAATVRPHGLGMRHRYNVSAQPPQPHREGPTALQALWPCTKFENHCQKVSFGARQTGSQSQSRRNPAPRPEVKDWAGTSARCGAGVSAVTPRSTG